MKHPTRVAIEPSAHLLVLVGCIAIEDDAASSYWAEWPTSRSTARRQTDGVPPGRPWRGHLAEVQIRPGWAETGMAGLEVKIAESCRMLGVYSLADLRSRRCEMRDGRATSLPSSLANRYAEGEQDLSSQATGNCSRYLR